MDREPTGQKELDSEKKKELDSEKVYICTHKHIPFFASM